MLIVRYWDKPHMLPPWISMCLRCVPPGCEQVLCADADFVAAIPADMEFPYAQLEPAHRWDFLRLAMACERGAVCVDADCVLLRTQWPSAEDRVICVREFDDHYPERVQGSILAPPAARNELLLRMMRDYVASVNASPFVSWTQTNSELMSKYADRMSPLPWRMFGPYAWHEYGRYLEPVTDSGFEAFVALHEPKQYGWMFYNKNMGPRLAGMTEDDIRRSDLLVCRLLSHYCPED